MPNNFKPHFQEIQQFLAQHALSKSELNDKKYSLTTRDAIFCAEDIIKWRRFYEGIEKALFDLKKKDSIVIDAGCWVGILWIFALKLWASKCIFIDSNPHTLKLCKKVVKHFWLEKQSIFQEWNATRISPKFKYDLLISETISSWFVTEDFPHIINHLKKYWNNNSIVIPEKFDITITELDKNEKQFYSHEKTIISKKLSNKEVIKLQFPATNKILWHTIITVYKNTIISPWDCISLGNSLDTTKKDQTNYFHLVT